MSSPNPTLIVSVEDTEYSRWQFALLLWTKRRAWPSADLLLVVSRRPGEAGTSIDWARELGPCGRLREIPSWREDPDPRVSSDDYAVYNKIRAVEDALTVLEDSAQVVLLDPDMIFLEEPDLQFGTRIAQEYWYMGSDSEARRSISQAGFDRALMVQGIGVPISISAGDLRKVACGWKRRTADLRSISDVRATVAWMADMWGFAFAADEAAIRFSPWDETSFLFDREAPRAIVHYCDRIEWSLHKRDWQDSPFGLPPSLWEVLRLYAIWDCCGRPPGHSPHLPLRL
jgi:hypothetical protein